MTPHIHAENMRLYAEDAAETDKPWKRWETLCTDGTWAAKKSQPQWRAENSYRRKHITEKADTTLSADLVRDADLRGALREPLTGFNSKERT